MVKWWGTQKMISAFIFNFRFIPDFHSNFEFSRFFCHVCNSEWMQLWIKLQWFVSTNIFCPALKNWLWKKFIKPWSPFQLQICQIKVFSSLKVRKIKENLISHASEVSIFTKNKELCKKSILRYVISNSILHLVYDCLCLKTLMNWSLNDDIHTT